MVFLNFRKACELIDRDMVLEIMKKYCAGPMCCYVSLVWERQKFFLRQVRFYSNPIEVNMGCTQGDTYLLIILNLIIDAIVRMQKRYISYMAILGCFYACTIGELQSY